MKIYSIQRLYSIQNEWLGFTSQVHDAPWISYKDSIKGAPCNCEDSPFIITQYIKRMFRIHDRKPRNAPWISYKDSIKGAFRVCVEIPSQNYTVYKTNHDIRVIYSTKDSVSAESKIPSNIKQSPPISWGKISSSRRQNLLLPTGQYLPLV